MTTLGIGSRVRDNREVTRVVRKNSILWEINARNETDSDQTVQYSCKWFLWFAIHGQQATKVTILIVPRRDIIRRSRFFVAAFMKPCV